MADGDRVYLQQVQRTEETAGTDRPGGLCRHIEHDPRSRGFADPAADPDALGAGPDRAVLWERYTRPLDQGNYGACTGFAMGGLLMTAPYYVPGRVLRTRDCFALYSLASRRFDEWPGGWPPEDTGSSGLAVMKAARAYRYLAEFGHAFGYDQARSVIAKKPFITGAYWFDTFDRPDSSGTIHLTSRSQIVGGHEWEMVGYDPADDEWRAANSWSPLWGDRGYFNVPGDVYRELLERQGDVTTITRALAE
jgi:hypothetical protein